METRVSIVSTVKNGENTIEQMITSVLDQSYKNIELIIVDDGSTDNTLNILKKYEKKDSRIVIIPTTGIGRVNALNLAIGKSNGEYVSNLDADDVIHPEKIQIQVENMNKKKNAFLLATETVIIHDSNIAEWSELTHNYKLKKVDSTLFYSNTINHSSVLMRKEILLQLGSYNENQISQIDYELWLRAFDNGKQMFIIPLPLTGKRIHQNQSFENKNRIGYTFRSFKLQMKYIFKNPKYFKYSIIILATFLLAQLPFSIRRKIKSVIGGRL